MGVVHVDVMDGRFCSGAHRGSALHQGAAHAAAQGRASDGPRAARRAAGVRGCRCGHRHGARGGGRPHPPRAPASGRHGEHTLPGAPIVRGLALWSGHSPRMAHGAAARRGGHDRAVGRRSGVGRTGVRARRRWTGWPREGHHRGLGTPDTHLRRWRHHHGQHPAGGRGRPRPGRWPGVPCSPAGGWPRTRRPSWRLCAASERADPRKAGWLHALEMVGRGSRCLRRPIRGRVGRRALPAYLLVPPAGRGTGPRAARRRQQLGQGPWRSLLGDETSRPSSSRARGSTWPPSSRPDTWASILPTCGVCGRLSELDDAAMVEQLRTHLLRADSPTPSIEALVHAFLPATYVDHTHADAVLALTNGPDGGALTRVALGENVIVLPYTTPGFQLALAAAQALEARPDAEGMVWSHHGLVTWGETARASYERMIRTSDSGRAIPGARRRPAPSAGAPPPGPAAGRLRPSGPRLEARAQRGASADLSSRLATVAPLIRGALAETHRRLRPSLQARDRAVPATIPSCWRLWRLPARARTWSLRPSPATTSSAPKPCLCGWRGCPSTTRSSSASPSRRGSGGVLSRLPGVPRPSRGRDAGGRAALRSAAARGPHPRRRSALCRSRPTRIDHRPRHHAAHRGGQGARRGDERPRAAARRRQRR